MSYIGVQRAWKAKCIPVGPRLGGLAAKQLKKRAWAWYATFRKAHIYLIYIVLKGQKGPKGQMYSFSAHISA
jgi:hypothetical protein